MNKCRVYDEKRRCWCIEPIMVYPETPIVKQGRTIQWYTGLADKNGKEIYQGDIVDWGGLNYLIEWNDIAYKWVGVCPYYTKYHHPRVEYFRDLMNGIVVGNIFDTPELLKK